MYTTSPEYDDCEEEEEDDEYVDCVDDATPEGGCMNKLCSILQNIDTNKGIPAFIEETQQTQQTQPPVIVTRTVSYFGPSVNINDISNMSYADALRKFYAELKMSETLTPSYDEIRKLLYYIDAIIHISKYDNHPDTVELFNSMKTYLISLTQYDAHNPHTFLKPTTEKWSGFVTTNSL